MGTRTWSVRTLNLIVDHWISSPPEINSLISDRTVFVSCASFFQHVLPVKPEVRITLDLNLTV